LLVGRFLGLALRLRLGLRLLRRGLRGNCRGGGGRRRRLGGLALGGGRRGGRSRRGGRFRGLRERCGAERQCDRNCDDFLHVFNFLLVVFVVSCSAYNAPRGHRWT